MEETPFDPYYRWLGIPASEQPADHYRLLGIVRFESNREIIDNASLRQISFVRTFALGEHAEHSQTLLNELAAARSILLNPASKETYDESLREQKKHSEPELAPSPNFPDAEVLSSHSSTVDIDPTSVVHAKLQRQENQDPSKPNLSVLLGSFILIISAGLLWGLIRVGQSTIKFISGPPPLAVAPFDAEQAKAHQEAWAEHLGIEVEVTNSIGMKLRVIPPGTFMMGEGNDAHEVTLVKPYMLGMYEVTQAQYKEVMDTNPSKFKGESNPIEMVRWADAVDFCRRLNNRPAEKSAGRVYRLPTETQWEHACRAGSTTTYSFGDDDSRLGNYAWYRNNANGKTHQVGSKPPNNWGAYDMHGNVWEWCQDGDGAYPNPVVSDPIRDAASEYRVVRGGSSFDSSLCRSGFHHSDNPSRRFPNIGFRVVCIFQPAKPDSDPAHLMKTVEETDSPSIGIAAPPLAVAPFDAEQAKAYQEAWAKYLGLPKTMTNSIGMDFVLIPPGQFEAGAVGDGKDLAGRFKVSQRQVSIDLPYYISATEITESQAVKLGWEAPAKVNQPSELPASGMHWHEAIRLLNQLSNLDGVAANYLLEDGKIIDQLDQYGYRLPSSDEWEFASRAGTVTRYFFGDEPDQIEEYSSIKSTMPVASGKANPFGLYDVHGNVSEWVQQNGTHEWKDNDGSHMHEMRGVSVPNAPQYAGNDFKNWHKRSNQWSNLGFRILLEISELSKSKS
jgi:formylglycine-generating enzyme required for sulfatase activity